MTPLHLRTAAVAMRSEAKTEVRVLLAQFRGDDSPVVLAAIDRTIWDHWDDEEETAWVSEAKRLFGADPTDYEVRQVTATLPTVPLSAAFEAPIVEGQVG